MHFVDSLVYSFFKLSGYLLQFEFPVVDELWWDDGGFGAGGGSCYIYSSLTVLINPCKAKG